MAVGANATPKATVCNGILSSHLPTRQELQSCEEKKKSKESAEGEDSPMT